MTTASSIDDTYPTRGIDARILLRHEPVLHAGSNARGPFTQGELLAYERRGFLVARDLFTAAEASELLGDVARHAAAMADDDPRLVREPGSDAVRSLFGFHRLDGALGRLASDARLETRARQILGSAVYVHQSRINRKPAFDGREFAWHSDFETWHSEDGMPGMRALSVSVALSRNDASNGPLLVIPGSHHVFVACAGETPEDHHRQSLRRQEYGVPPRAILRQLAALHPVEAIVAEPGTAVFFDCNLLHGSSGNIAPADRTSAFVVYNSVENPLGRPRSHAARPEYVAAREDVAQVPSLVTSSV